MNKKVYEDNVRGGIQDNGLFWKIHRFPRNKFWKSIWCLLSAPTFNIGGWGMWENHKKMSGKKRKRSLIRSKVDLYEVCASLFQILYYC